MRFFALPQDWTLESPSFRDIRGQTTVFLKTLSFSRGAGFFP